MTTLLIIDTETTGLDPETDRIIEVGALLYDADTGQPVASYATLISDGERTDNAAKSKNEIRPATLQHPNCLPYEAAMSVVHGIGHGADFYVAHRADFDRQWLPDDWGPWICTKFDAEWPRCEPGAGLVHLALAHGVGVTQAHRAIYDCLTLAAVLSRVHEIEGGLGDWIARATEPRVEVRALVSYDDRELAKAAGFSWDPQRKLWTKRVRISQLERLRSEWRFDVREVGV